MEISTQNVKKGTFTLVILIGNDNQKRKNPLETWKDLSLDPNSANYISKRCRERLFENVRQG